MHKTTNDKRKAPVSPALAKRSNAVGKAQPGSTQQQNNTTEKLIARIERLSVQLAESRQQAKLAHLQIEELTAELRWGKERGPTRLNYSQKLHRLGRLLAALFVDEMAEPALVAAFQRAITEVKDQLSQKDQVHLPSLEAHHYFPVVALALTPKDKLANATQLPPFKQIKDDDVA
jgi:hypothetical protein